jgi:DNA-binding SARP family transcriptional activator
MEPSTLRIRLFGALDLRLGEVPLALESARAQSLLAHLLLHPEAPQPRDHLAFLLWPDSTEPQARTNLRHVLHTLRHALPQSERFLDVTPRTLLWRADSPCWLDVAAFTEAVSHAEQETEERGVAALQNAVALYRGDLLAGCYDEWILDEREQLRQRFQETLARLAALLERRRDYTTAIGYAQRLLRHDPLHEETYRLLMRLHDARGEPARALRVYHSCAATLERELGIEPSPATHELYETLLPRDRAPAAVPDQATRLGDHPLIGRTAEWAQLAAHWRATETGRAQLVLLSGEAGIGKSRLIDEFRGWCARRGAVTADARSYPAEGALAFAPIVSWLRAEDLRALLGRLDRARQAELACLLPELRATVPNAPSPQPQSGSEHRLRLFDAAATALLTTDGPLLLTADDLQWCDRETLQFLHYLLRLDPGARLLVAATARLEEIDPQHPLNDLVAGLQAWDRFTEIPLGRLTREETALLSQRLAGNRRDEAEADRLFDATEGNPLFVVEALRAGWQGGGGGSRWLTPKVQSVIASRLTQLSPPARELVAVAATIGREFTADTLAFASEGDEETLVRGLDELWRRRIVRERDVDAYDFSHDRIREVAYLALSSAQRRHNHRRVASALERLHRDDLAPVSGQLAAHYERAGDVSRAVRWYERAADAAQRLHAPTEAVRLLERALDLLRMLPVTPENQARELAIRSLLPSLLGWVEGWASTHLADVEQRALALTDALAVEPAPPLLRSLAISSLSRRDFAATRDHAERLRARGVRDADDMLLVEANYVLGIAAFWQGELTAARDRFETAVHRYRPQESRAHLLHYGLDPKVVCQSRLGNTLWFLGLPLTAVQTRDTALALAAEIGHPYSQAVAHVFSALLSLELGDLEGVRAGAAFLTGKDAERVGRPTQVSSEAIAGYVDVVDGRTRTGLARIEWALEETRDTGHAPGIYASNLRCLLAACEVMGDARAGLIAADRALTSEPSVRLWEAETRRLRGEFLAALNAAPADVEAELARALVVARRQGARSLELRTVASILRLRQQRGDKAGIRAARDALQAILEQMPEARETSDYHAAASLLH